MHNLIITPYLLQGSMLANSLKRQNIKSLTCCPQNLTDNWCPDTDALIFPHTLSETVWGNLLPFLQNLKKHVPFVLIGDENKNIFTSKKFHKLLKRTIFIDASLSLGQIPTILKEITNKGSATIHSNQLKIGDFTLNRNNRTVLYEEKRVYLTRKEFFLLELLMLNVGNITTRESIINYVWDKRDYVAPNTIDVYISRLRKKIPLHSGKSLIETIPCLGYRINL